MLQLCHGPVQDIGNPSELGHLVDGLEVDLQLDQLTVKLLFWLAMVWNGEGVLGLSRTQVKP